MPDVTNISITDRAARLLGRERVERTRLAPDDVFTLDYISSFTEPDGTTVDGFRPGYSAGYARAGDVRADWLRLRLPDGTALCFWPRFGWDAEGHYVLDVISERYAILSLERRF